MFFMWLFIAKCKNDPDVISEKPCDLITPKRAFH